MQLLKDDAPQPRRPPTRLRKRLTPEQRKNQKIVRAFAWGAGLAVGGILAGAVTHRQVGELNQLSLLGSPNRIEEQQMAARNDWYVLRDAMLRAVTDFDRSAMHLAYQEDSEGRRLDPGVLQKLISNHAWEVRYRLNQQITDSNYDCYKETQEMCAAIAQSGIVDRFLEAGMGQNAVIEFENADGRVVRQPMTDAQLQALAVFDMLALDQIQALDQAPEYSDNKVKQEFAAHYNAYYNAFVAYLEVSQPEAAKRLEEYNRARRMTPEDIEARLKGGTDEL